MAFLEIHENAQLDLQKIYLVDEMSVARIFALFEQIEQDPDLQDKLLDPKFVGQNVECMRWVEQFRSGNDLYRIKIWDPDDRHLIPYRIIYAYYPKLSDYVVLAVVPRGEFNYEKDNQYTERILHDYREYL